MIKTKLLILIIEILTVSLGLPQDADKDARIIFSESTHDDPKSYQYKFETSNGISQAEIGDFEETSFESGITIKKGYYSYVGPDNVRYTVTYVADEKGYRPKLHRSDASKGPVETSFKSTFAIDGIDDDRIGTNLLISLGGGGIG